MFGKRKIRSLTRQAHTTFSVSFLSDSHSRYKVQAVNGERCHGYLASFCTEDVSQDVGPIEETYWAVVDEQGNSVRRLKASDTVTI
jgi:hypothetical protein